MMIRGCYGLERNLKKTSTKRGENREGDKKTSDTEWRGQDGENVHKKRIKPLEIAY